MSEDQAEAEKKAKIEARKEKRRKRLKGFASTVSSILGKLNTNEDFKRIYRNQELRFALVATDFPPGVLLKIDKGEIGFENLEHDDVKKTQKDGLIQCTLDRFMALTTGKLDPIKGWITRKLKLRGPKKLIKLMPMFDLLKGPKKDNEPSEGA
ncbi:MAG: SCP2 sterol-binding domain-containing protein [Candidatus Hodarchaeota archaeon]